MSHLTIVPLLSDILALITPWLLIEDLIRLKSTTATVSSRLDEPGVIHELRVTLPKLPPPPLTSYLTRIIIKGADRPRQYSEEQDLYHMKWLQSLPRALEAFELTDHFPLLVDDPSSTLPWFVRESSGHIPVRVCELFPNLRTFKWTSHWSPNWSTCLQIWLILGLPATLERLKLPFWLEDDAILPHLPPQLKRLENEIRLRTTSPLFPDGWTDSIEELSFGFMAEEAVHGLSMLKNLSRLQTLELNYIDDRALSFILPHLPSTLTNLTLRFSMYATPLIKKSTCTPAHLARLPRHLTSLTLDNLPKSLVLGEFLPPNLTYLHVKGNRELYSKLDSMFKQLPTCLLSLKILKIQDARVTTLSWLPCDRLTTFHLKSDRPEELWSESHWTELLSSIPSTRPNNITNLKLDYKPYGKLRLPPLHLLPPNLSKRSIHVPNLWILVQMPRRAPCSL